LTGIVHPEPFGFAQDELVKDLISNELLSGNTVLTTKAVFGRNKGFLRISLRS
jgi:hypothetical protein